MSHTISWSKDCTSVLPQNFCLPSASLRNKIICTGFAEALYSLKRFRKYSGSRKPPSVCTKLYARPGSSAVKRISVSPGFFARFISPKSRIYAVLFRFPVLVSISAGVTGSRSCSPFCFKYNRYIRHPPLR